MTGDSSDPERDPAPGRRLFQTRVRGLLDRLGFWPVFLGFLVLGVVASRIPALSSYAWVCFVLAGLLPLLLAQSDADNADDADPGFEYEQSARERAQYLGSALFWSLTPWGLFAQALQIGGQAAAMVRYRRQYPSTDRHVPETTLRLPFDGEWTVVNGGVTEATSHSWDLVAQRYAYDFLVADEDGDTHDGDGTSLDDYYAFGQPMRAPADGTVVSAKDGLRDFPRPGSGWLEWRTWDVRGNHVVVQHADGEYSLLAHLREGSVAVEPGDAVARGDVVGECGNSGHSGEPHLHYQLQDTPSFWTAAGLVPRFVDVAATRSDGERGDRGAARPAEDGVAVEYLSAGDRVESTARTASDDSVRLA